MRIVHTDSAPAPAGHYSQGIIHNNLIYVSEQLPINPSTGEKCLGSIEEQSRQTIKNVFAILDEAGNNPDNVLKVTVYISDISLWDLVNKVYSEMFGNHKPARAIVPTKELHNEFKIEIETIAAL